MSYGKPFPKEFPARREVFVARSRDEAIRLCAPFLAAKYQAYEQWGQEQGDARRATTTWAPNSTS